MIALRPCGFHCNLQIVFYAGEEMPKPRHIMLMLRCSVAGAM